MNMIKEFVPYKESLELKELGFDEYCFGFWDAYNGGTHFFLKPRSKPYWWIKLFNPQPDITEYSQGLLEYEEGINAVLAPTFSQAFRWFREKYKLHSKVDIQDVELDWYDYEILEVKEGQYNNDLHMDMNFKSYEEAELECLKKLIEIVKDEN